MWWFRVLGSVIDGRELHSAVLGNRCSCRYSYSLLHSHGSQCKCNYNSLQSRFALLYPALHVLDVGLQTQSIAKLPKLRGTALTLGKSGLDVSWTISCSGRHRQACASSEERFPSSKSLTYLPIFGRNWQDRLMVSITSPGDSPPNEHTLNAWAAPPPATYRFGCSGCEVTRKWASGVLKMTCSFQQVFDVLKEVYSLCIPAHALVFEIAVGQVGQAFTQQLPDQCFRLVWDTIRRVL